MPYLRMFDGKRSAREIDLRRAHTLIGRGSEADVMLKHPAVSRAHAVIVKRDGDYVVEDKSSRAGTFVNGDRIPKSQTLKHGDTIQVGEHVLEFRTDDEARRKEFESGEEVDRALRMRFKPLPEGVGIRYRRLSVKPHEIFERGDTLRVGEGGILLRDADPPPADTCIELEITAPGGRSNTFPGEVLAHLMDAPVPGMCVKLHSLREVLFQQVLLESRRGSWRLLQEGWGNASRT